MSSASEMSGPEEIRGEPGEIVDDAIERVIKLCKRDGERRVLLFNDIPLHVRPDSSAPMIYADWWQKSEARRVKSEARKRRSDLALAAREMIRMNDGRSPLKIVRWRRLEAELLDGLTVIDQELEKFDE